MPFPAHDPYWAETADFVRKHRSANEPLMAPDEFAEIFPTVYAYDASHWPATIPVPWVVLHKGMLNRVAEAFLDREQTLCTPVFANAVFVVFCSDRRLPRLADNSEHYRSLLTMLEMPRSNGPTIEVIDAPPEPIRPFQSLDVEGVRQEMNRRYSRSEHDAFGGYEHPHLWDKARFAEVNRLFAKLIGPVDGLDVLELGCGIGRNVSLFEQSKSYVGIDLSDVAIERAQRLHGHRPNFAFRQMDATHLNFPDASFDRVAGIEIIEHVQNAERMLREVLRVLRPGGRFYFNSANRDSLHLRMLRKLGLPEFRGTYEHFREFGFNEIKEILHAIGFSIEAGEGVFLLPYRELPGIDSRLTALTYDDAQTVEMLRELGQRAGPEYGFEFVIAARKIRPPTPDGTTR